MTQDNRETLQRAVGIQGKIAKDTALLIEELKVIAESMGSYYIAKELLAAAERLRELENIAEFYRKEAERLAIKIWRKEKCKNT